MKYLRSLIALFFSILITLIAVNNITFAQSPCGIPSNLHIVNLTTTSGQLVWNIIPGATGYVLRFRPVGTSIWIRQPSANATEIITNLIPNTLYEAKVRCDCNGTVGVYSVIFNFTTLSNISCNVPNVYYFASDSITANTCTISWRNIQEAISYNVQFRIRYSNDDWLEKSSGIRSLLLTELDPSTQYEFRVQTLCLNGESDFSSPGIFTTKNNNCGTPVNLYADDVTTSSAILKWENLNCAASYNLKFRQVGMDWRIINTLLSSFNFSGLTEATAYEFIVQSQDSTGNTSAFSQSSVFFTASESCGLPTNIVACSIEKNKATIAWNSVIDASEYNVRYRLGGALSWQYFNAEVNNAILTGLSPNNTYEYQVQTICSGPGGKFSDLSSFETLADSSQNIPVPDHIVICIMENKAYSQIIGNFLTPNINSLANDSKSAVFSESFGISHPSQPNYLDLFSGNNQRVTDDNLPPQHFTSPNLASELLNAGKSFIEYNEGLPSVGYDGETFGKYARKHNPVANWMGTDTNQVSSTLNQPFTSFPSDFNLLPTVSFVSPDLTNSMHDGSLGTSLANGDAWFNANMVPYLDWAKTHNSLFILTFDEDDSRHSNRIVTIFTGSMVVHGVFDQHISHYNILRTIEEMYGLNFIGNSDTVSAIHGCWTNGFRMASKKSVSSQAADAENDLNIYPNPAYDKLHVSINLKEASEVSINICNSIGVNVFREKTNFSEKGNHVFDIPIDERKLSAGIYLIDATCGDKKFTKRFLITRQ